MTSQHLDEELERLHRTGPEFDGWLSNHGPMAADALIRLGYPELTSTWVARYERRLESAPTPRWPIDPSNWRDPLGDPTRIGDWCALLLREVQEQPWTEVLERWWPRLLPGALASACHGLIRTGHAVRALNEQVTKPRLNELALALAYWAGRWQPLPEGRLAVWNVPSTHLDPEDALPLAAVHRPLNGSINDPRFVRRDVTDGRPIGLDRVLTAMDRLPHVPAHGGIRSRLAALPAQPGWWPSRVALPAPENPADVPHALDTLVDAAVIQYRAWAHAEPVMLVHAATAPRAAGLVLKSLPVGMWQQTFDLAWAVTAAIGSAYRPVEPHRLPAAGPTSMSEAVDACVHTADAHAIKFAEVARESAARGNHVSLESANLAAALMAR